MRKHQQKQVLEVLESLREVQAAELYADCQDAAISIGEFIESIKGEGTETVALLEDYCELVFKASNGETGIKALEKQLIRIENSVKNELKPTIIEMVFLSYKASMSDSIESIYMAAKDDPSCDTYWIPIPYYEKNPDESFGKMHYEGADFYKSSIECTDWQEYNIAERRPDVIFTFSPYDAFNVVTSVHPDFYCERLRELTDLLVYIPYFVTGEKTEAPYTVCDAALFAHLVIVQSESVRQCYISDYKGFEDNGYSRMIYGAPEEKFVALGSPKFDVVINAKPEDYPLPEEWSKLVELNDGKKKNIILFATSLAPAMNNPEQFLIKLQHVLDTFNKRDDIILWWRPHPLTENTYNTMYPELVEKYINIVNNYKNAAFGIFDDTPELHRAITWSDAYYGDFGSVIYLYAMTGKHIMLSNLDVLDDELLFEPTTIYATKDKLWFTIRYINSLFSMDKDKWELELAGSFPDEDECIMKYTTSLYGRPVLSDETLYFPPHLAKNAVSMSTKDNILSVINLNVNDKSISIDRAFIIAIAYENYIFFTPGFSPAIVRFNISTGEVKYFDEWLKHFTRLKETEIGGYFGLPCLIDDSIWLASTQRNVLLEFDIKKNIFNIHTVGDKEYRFAHLCFDGESLWITPFYDSKTPLIKWNPKTNETKEFFEIYSGDEIKNFTIPVLFNGYVWLLPNTYGSAYKICTQNNLVQVINEFELIPPIDEKEQAALRTALLFSDDESIYTYDFLKSLLLEYNSKTKKRREKKISYSVEISRYLKSKYISTYTANSSEINASKDWFYNESNLMLLNDYIDFTNDKYGELPAEAKTHRIKTIGEYNKNIVGTSGNDIFEFIKKRVLTR